MKTILITGSTDGIGKLAAMKLAKSGHNLYLHGRNPEKLRNVVAEIKVKSDNPNINGFVADFSIIRDVEALASRIKSEVKHLDVLINNAGIFKSPVSTTSDGYDIRFTVNYFAPYLLTNELLPLLKKSQSPRIINLSSAAQASVSFEALVGRASISAQSAYAQSKLALTMWSFDLAQKQKDIAVIAVNPGSLLNTKMVQEAYGKHWSSADKGANILVELATLDDYVNHSGKYFDNDLGNPKGRFNEAHLDAYDDTLIDRLITDTEKIITHD